MADSLFNIFGDHLTRQAMKNVSRQPLHNIENMGKTVSSGPVKPNEPLKKGEVKKSFLNNAGKALQLQGLQNNTPVRKPFTPRAVNVGSMIYNDSEHDDKSFSMDDLRFTKPTYKYDNYRQDLLDYLPIPEPEIRQELSPPNTPPPATKPFSMEFDNSYQDEFFTDDFSSGSLLDEDLGLPDLY
ncbi:uncharacterized protein LOC128678018 isoform X1 [Plodia interpunctella]|uniref:uncharacterized protein LOC128678018 isoform X1 n=1 Tax=Plodia interpunctella TaxID=58824 RepID=UPI002367ADF8|nr:uncharacterized protein LOC128678018 isoform X1 [Plodia interpunctella]